MLQVEEKSRFFPALPDLEPLSLAQRLSIIAEACDAPVFTSSLGAEDQVITHVIATEGLPIRIVTLNTGRLFPETLALIAATEKRYRVILHQLHPEARDVDAYVAAHGENGFYDSVALRKKCCHIRKVIPLNACLAQADGWITGMRRAHSDNRSLTPFCERDETHGVIKFNPVADWSNEALWALIKAHDVPVNPLHQRGYPSIGCEPCTRAIKPGEPERAGRWWWEENTTQECGLHPSRTPVKSGSDEPVPEKARP